MGCHLPEALHLYPHAVQTDDDVPLVAVVGQGRLFPDVGGRTSGAGTVCPGGRIH